MSYAQGIVDPFTRRRHTLRGLGASAPPSSAAPDMDFTLQDQTPGTTAMPAVLAIMAASATARRSSIPEVRAFQSAYGHGLVVDGIYGPATRAALVSVTGRSDLPAVGSSSGTRPAPSPSGGGTSTPSPDTSSFVPGGGTTPPWLVPVAVVSTLVLIAGGVMYMQKPVKANRRRSR